MKAFLFLIFFTFLVVGCSENYNKIYRDRYKKYLSEEFNITLSKHERVIIFNTRGCEGCLKSTFSYIVKNHLYSSCIFILSKSFYHESFYDYKVSELSQSIKNKYYIDNKDICEVINLPLNGITIIEMVGDNISFKTIVILCDKNGKPINEKNF